MTRDPLDLLRAADPVPQPVAYPEDEVARRVAHILDGDGRRTVLLDDRPVRSRRRWVAPGLVAAAVLVLAVLSAVVFSRGRSDTPPAGASPVTCAVSTSGGAKAVRARLAQAETVISSRILQLNGSARSFVTDPDDGTVGFTPGGISVAKAAQACRAVTVAVRPVVARPVDLDTRAPRSSDPLSGLTFRVPATESAYARLSAARRAQLARAMSHYDCTGLSAPTAVGLTCVGGYSQVLLLGPALVSGPDVSTAVSTPPGPDAGGLAEWTVRVSLRTAAAARLRAFTTAHHAAGYGLESCGTRAGAPCTDFLAFTVGAALDSVPLTTATLSGPIQLTGSFDQFTAQGLAADYTAAAVQLRPR